MESLALALSIPPNSGVYMRALEIYHKLRVGEANFKFTDECCMVTSLKLAADSFRVKFDFDMATRKVAATSSKTLVACLEFAAATIGVAAGLVSIEGVCIEIGYPSIIKVALGIANAIQDSLTLIGADQNRRTQFSLNNTTVIAASIYVALQTIGIRVALSVVCSAAYANIQQAQRCSIEIKALLSKYLEEQGGNTELIKSIKAEGKQLSKRRLVPSGKSQLPDTLLSERRVNKKSKEHQTTIMEPSLIEKHYLSDLGFAVMLTTPPKALSHYDGEAIDFTTRKFLD